MTKTATAARLLRGAWLWVLAAGALAGAVACWPATRTRLPGCGKDTDCKGTRICVQGQCVDPPPRGAVVATVTDGGTVMVADSDAAPQQTAPPVVTAGEVLSASAANPRQHCPRYG